MSAFSFLIAWANAPFSIAVGIAAVFALLQVSGAMGVLAGGDDAGGDADNDVDHDVDHDVDQDAEGGHEAESEDAADRGLGVAALAPLGFGKIPFSVIWQTYALAFAATGFGINMHYLGSGRAPPLHSLAWSVPASLVAGYLAVAVVARLLGPVLSSTAELATSRAQLVGQIGVVISSRVDQNFGEVRIRDKTGHDIRVVCKLTSRSPKPVEEHRNVVVVDYEPERGELLVEALDD